MYSKLFYLSLSVCVLAVTGCESVSISSLLGENGSNSSGAASSTEKSAQQAKTEAKAYAKDVREYNAAIKVDPNDWSAYIDRSYCSVMYGQLERAMQDANKAVEIAPEEPDAYAIRSLVFSEMNRHEAALVDINNAIDLEIDYSDFYTSRGFELECLGRYREALADYEYAIKLDDQDALPWNNYASVLSMAPYAELRDGKTAVKAAVMAVKLAEDSEIRCYCLDTLGSSWAEAGKFDKAIKASELALKDAEPEHKAEIQSRIELYKSGKAFRLPIIEQNLSAQSDHPADESITKASFTN